MLFTSDHRLHRFAVQFYLTREFFLSVLGDFTASALRANDGIVVITTEAHRQALADRLGKIGIDTASLIGQNRLVSIDAENLLASLLTKAKLDFSRFLEVVGGAIAKVSESSNARQPHAMVFSELGALLWARHDFSAVMEVDQFWRILGRRISFSYLSCYPIERFAAPGKEELFLRICARHSTVIPPDDYPSADAAKRIMQATAKAYADPSLLLPGHGIPDSKYV